MIPTNSNSPNNCDPISSNCVIWQGPDLTCVDVCQGDTISNVVAALCTQLTLLETLIGSGNTEFNIANINQSELTGNTATNLEELIQLMIDNIIINQGGGTGTGSGDHGKHFDCDDVFACAVTGQPPCFEELAGFNNGESLIRWISAVSQELCDLQTSGSTTQAVTTSLSTRVSSLETQPTGEQNPMLYSSGVVTKGQLTPIATVVQALDSQFITLRNTTGNPGNITLGINNQPADIGTPVSTEGYTKALRTSPNTAGDALYNIWLAVEDLRAATKDIQDNCCSSVQMTRMGGIRSFYANGDACATALTAAATATNCTDVWNSTGVQFDTTCRAYTDAYNATGSTELLNNRYYALCPGGPIAKYQRTVPYWTDVRNSCTG
jgi:hypothetical protein